MKLDAFPDEIREFIYPQTRGEMLYRCLSCNKEFSIKQLLYTCPECKGLLLLENKDFERIKEIGGEKWRAIFDYRKMLNSPPLKGIFLYYEFIAPVIPLDLVIYLGEGHTPLVKANSFMTNFAGAPFYFKNDGLNPSASFKDRGMACALSYVNFIAKERNVKEMLAVCASTGDTSASAALYASYLSEFLKSAVLLPKGKVTPQQLSQPLGSGAKVLEIPGVFDDCMKVVEKLADDYHVILLNSKNSWRILGQESFSFEIAQDFDYQVGDKVVVVPIGNAGNITAVMSGFLKFYDAGVIEELPKIIGVQSEHADPVYRYYMEAPAQQRKFVPVAVRPSVAQAAMIGNPVSMPRVIKLVEDYERAAGKRHIFVVQVTEQEIMDCMIIANRHGHIACTQGGESLAGFRRAVQMGLVESHEIGVLDSTAHAIKFANFQQMYFEDSFGPEFQVKPKEELKNAPILVCPPSVEKFPGPGTPLRGKEMSKFVEAIAKEIATILELKAK